MVTSQGDASTVAAICSALTSDNLTGAAQIARSQWPFTPTAQPRRPISNLESTQVFVRDGFVDRYTGKRLVFPGTLRLLSHFLAEEVPYHRNWKMDSCHPMYWELYPTVDHLVPLGRGGDPKDQDNLTTTCMLKNQAKANWTLEELGWTLHPPGSMEDWDGLVHWFIDQFSSDAAIRGIRALSEWHRVAAQVLG